MNYTINFTETITVKTMIRAKPGVVVLQDATVIDKYNLRDLKKRIGTKK